MKTNHFNLVDIQWCYYYILRLTFIRW